MHNRSPMRRLSLASALLLVSSGSVAAQEAAASLSSVTACRLNAELISLSFSYHGGACEATGDAGVEVGDAGTAVVIVPVVVTNDQCTEQASDVQSTSAVAVPDEVTSLEVRLAAPDGEVKAAGNTDIAPSSPDCVPPKPVE